MLDIGAGSGFFSFEFERRGASVTATDLPTWFDHDFGPAYQPDRTEESGHDYLHTPFDIAKEALDSKVQKKHINVYDITPDSIGTLEFVFSGSLLIHLTDPIKALWNIARVTQEKAIIATVVSDQEVDRPIARMIGDQRGDSWWIPTQACLELMAVSAGFEGIEWVSDFRMDFRDGTPGPYHGVLHAYPTAEHWSPKTLHRDVIIARYQELSQNRLDTERLKAELEQLRSLVAAYERRRVIRFTNWLSRVLGR